MEKDKISDMIFDLNDVTPDGNWICEDCIKVDVR